jgi:hypothetical protein
MSEGYPAICLENGIKLSFEDRSNRYFGDFYRICIVVTIESADNDQVAGRMERRLEKMGVTTERLATEKKVLIDSFLATSRAYLEKENFPEQLLQRVKQKKNKPVFLRNL